MERSRGFRLQADIIVVSAAHILAPGQIEVHGGRVVAVTHRTDHVADVHLEGYALLPGLVNPHTHLEFSDMSRPLPSGRDFSQWVHSLLAQRRARGNNPDEQLVSALSSGMRESRAAGVAALADIVTPPWTPQHLAIAARQNFDPESLQQSWPDAVRSRFSLELLQDLIRASASSAGLPAVTACVEQLGLTVDRMASAISWRQKIDDISRADWPACLQALGLSPHAPYSTPESLIHATLEAAVEHGRLVAMHIAESAAERQWIDFGSGPFAELHAGLGVENFIPAATWIVDACHELARAPRGLIIHGNYLNEAELDCIAKHRDRLSVVYCPRTHQHFEHQAYPLEQFSKRGIRVVFATDSRSSNPDLNLWQEACTALSQHGSLRPTEAFAAITDGAAKALGCDEHYGSLRPGRAAVINAVPLEHGTQLSDIEQLFAGWFDRQAHPIPLL